MNRLDRMINDSLFKEETPGEIKNNRKNTMKKQKQFNTKEIKPKKKYKRNPKNNRF